MAVQVLDVPLTIQAAWQSARAHLVAEGYAQNTVDTYGCQVRHLERELQALRVAKVTADGVLLPLTLAPLVTVFAFWREDRVQGKRRYKEAAVNTKIDCLRGFYKALVDAGEIADTPFRRFHLRKTKTKKLKRRISDREVAGALAFAERHPDFRRFTLYLALVFFLGLRASEVRALTWGAALIHERLLLVRIPGGSPKGKRERWVPRPQYVTDLLLRLRAVTPNADADDYVFQGRGEGGSTMLSRGQFDRLFKLPIQEAVISDFTPHAARHYYIQALLERGVNVPQTAEIVGHQDWRTTEEYARALAKETGPARKVVEDLTQRLRPEANSAGDEGSSDA